MKYMLINILPDKKWVLLRLGKHCCCCCCCCCYTHNEERGKVNDVVIRNDFC